MAWVWLGKMAMLDGRFDEAEDCLARASALPLYPAQLIMHVLTAAEIPLRRGRLDQAWRAFERAVAVCRAQPQTYVVLWGAGLAMIGLAQVAHAQAKSELAQCWVREAITRFINMEHRGGLWRALAVLAVVSAARGRSERAARFWGATQTGLGTRSQTDITGDMAVQYEAVMDAARRQLGEDRYQELLAQGRAMTMEQAARYALEDG